MQTNRRIQLFAAVMQWPTVIAAIGLASAIVVVELGWRDPSPGLTVDVPVPRWAEPPVERLRSTPLTGIEEPRAAAIASGVIFGRTEHVTAADQEAFLSSGLQHLLAASGQNVALVAGCCIVLARLAGAGRTTGAVLALGAIPAYVMVVGGGASIVRAGAMGMLTILAWVAGRLPDMWHVIVVVAAATCWVWPGAHRGLGMQLSFACVTALAWAVVPLTRQLQATGVPSWLAGPVAATALCSAATAPILYLRTGAAPLTGIVANVVAVPLAGCLLVVGLAGSVLAASLEQVLPGGAGRVLLAPSALLASLLVEVAHRAAALPAAQTTSPLTAIGLPLVGLLASRPRLRSRRARRVLASMAAACLVLPLGAVLLRDVPVVTRLSGAPPPLQRGTLRIAVLDVGQGDATLLATDDEAVLVDTGPPDGDVVRRVREAGVRSVDGIVLTHDSLDHRGGLEAAHAALEPEWVAMPRGAPGPWKRVRQLAGPTLVELCSGDALELAAARVDVLHPRCDGSITPRTGDLHNDGAMVLLVRHGAIRALLPADAEAPVLLGLGLPQLDLLRVAHHGSSDERLPALLDRTAPEVAAISAGAGNDYGHPHPQVLAELRDRGIRVLRTDRSGSAAFDSDGRTLRLAG